jgi:hypothetical protein
MFGKKCGSSIQLLRLPAAGATAEPAAYLGACNCCNGLCKAVVVTTLEAGQQV